MQNKVVVQAAALALMGLIAGTAVAADTKTYKPAKPETTTVMVQGVQVAIDPATGRLVAPTAAQRAALSAAMVRDASAPTMKTLGNTRAAALSQRPRTEAEALKTLKRPNNGKYAAVMQVPETLVSSLVAETRADGSLDIHHQGDSAASQAQTAKEVVR